MVTSPCRTDGSGLLPAKKIPGVNETSKARTTGCFRVNCLVADHRRAFQIDAVGNGQFRNHSRTGLAALTVVIVVMRTNLPPCQDAAKSRVKSTQCRLYLTKSKTSALDTRLIGNHKDQVVAHGRESLLNSREQLDFDGPVRIEWKLTGFVHCNQSTDEVAKQRNIAAGTHFLIF